VANDKEAEESSGWLKRRLLKLWPRSGDAALRAALEEIIEQVDNGDGDGDEPMTIGSQERILLVNILNLRHLTAYDVMVPRADIVAVDERTSFSDFLEVIKREGHSRIPVYREHLDDIQGLVHLKDAIAFAAQPGDFDIARIKREVLIIAPSVLALDLLLQMRKSRRHMALVIDEYGGIDGLVTIEDLVEEIVGEISDEHDLDDAGQLTPGEEGTLLADARVPIKDFEELVGPTLSDEEREADIDTLGGLVVALAGRVPARGELIRHPPSNLIIEVLEADPRRLKHLRIRGVDPDVLERAKETEDSRS